MNYVIIYDYKTSSGWVRRRYETSRESFYNMILGYIKGNSDGTMKIVETSEGTK